MWRVKVKPLQARFITVRDGGSVFSGAELEIVLMLNDEEERSVVAPLDLDKIDLVYSQISRARADHVRKLKKRLQLAEDQNSHLRSLVGYEGEGE